MPLAKPYSRHDKREHGVQCLNRRRSFLRRALWSSRAVYHQLSLNSSDRFPDLRLQTRLLRPSLEPKPSGLAWLSDSVLKAQRMNQPLTVHSGATVADFHDLPYLSSRTPELSQPELV